MYTPSASRSASYSHLLPGNEDEAVGLLDTYLASLH
jgi:hypothetical protein